MFRRGELRVPLARTEGARAHRTFRPEGGACGGSHHIYEPHYILCLFRLTIMGSPPVLKARSIRPYRPGRSGSYSPTRQGYRAFHPKPLPPDPPLEISPRLLSLLADASTELGRLDGAADVLPDPDFFVYSYVRKEAVLSSQIEGTRSSLADLLDFEAGAGPAGYPRDVREVANYVDALNRALAALRDGQEISLALVREAHRTLLHRVRGHRDQPGRFKTRQNWIGSRGSSPATADYVPPPPEETPKLMAELAKYLQSDSLEPSLLKAALVHAQFETIHPFLDGNGRMGRLLVALLLARSGTTRHPVLYLSYFFLKNREEYTRRLQRVRGDGDWEGWVEFFLRGVRETSIQASHTARAVLEMRQNHQERVDRLLGARAARGQKLLEQLFHQPVITVAGVARATGTTFPPANALVDEFVRLGLLTEITGRRRNRFFRYTPYISLLQRDRAPSRSGGSARPGAGAGNRHPRS